MINSKIKLLTVGWIFVTIIWLNAGCVSEKNKALNDSANSSSQPENSSIEPDEASEKLLSVICSKQKCRDANTVQIFNEKGQLVTVNLPKVPVIMRDFIDLVKDETLFVQAEPVGGRLALLRAVDAVTAPDKTVKFSLKQVALLPNQYTMLLQVDNPFNRYLKYQIRFQTLGSDDFFNTVTCAVKPNETAVESFPFPIVQVLISEIQLSQSDDLCSP